MTVLTTYILIHRLVQIQTDRLLLGVEQLVVFRDRRSTGLDCKHIKLGFLWEGIYI